jgi:small conductance mechanosensitive channel
MSLSTAFTTGGILAVLSLLIKPLLILIVCKILVTIATKLVSNVLSKTALDKGIATFTKSAVKIVIWAIGIIMIAESFGIDTTSLVAVVSIASLALSLSVQNILTNVFSGITILISKPFKVGDFVEVCSVSGTVRAIGIMRTTLVTTDNKIELIPNSDIADGKILNYSTEENRRVDFHFTASYDNSTDSVREAISEAIYSESRILVDPEPFIAINAYNANDIDYVVRVWVKNSDYWDVYFSLNEKVREAYAKHGVEFSYPHTVVHMVK